MSWFNRKTAQRKPRKGQKRSAILKRRGASAERVIFWAKRFGLVFGCLVFLGWLGAWFFMSEASTRFAQWTENKFYSRTANAGFAVQDILVEGRHYTDIDAIRAIISSNKGDPLFAFKPDDAQSQLQKLSWVKSVQVERRFPDTIYVNIHERKPMALWQRNKRLSLIDEEGVVLTEHKLERFQDYVIVIGASVPEQAPAFLRLLRAEPEIQKRVEAATLVSNRRWDVTLKNGAIIKLPEEEPALALRRLAAMHEEEQLMDKDIKAIDVRELNRITVRTFPGAVQEYKTGYQKASGGAI